MPSSLARNRREFLKFAGSSAAAMALSAAVWPLTGCSQLALDDHPWPAAKRSKIYVLSDLHIGDDSITCWYQKRHHEPFLMCILDEIIDRREEVNQLILLGDAVDFWTYIPEVRPPTFQAIAAANPNIFGPAGKLVEVLRALEGRVTVLQGNHDMGITQKDWDTIRSPEGYTPRLVGDFYQPLGTADPRLLVTHGHRFTMFNAPDASTPYAPLPMGHFVTRSVAHRVHQQLAGTGRTAADLLGQGAPNGMDIAGAFGGIINDLPGAIGHDHDVVTLLLELIRNTSGLSDNAPIILPNGATSSLAQAKAAYTGLWRRWAQPDNAGENYLNDVLALRALQADAQGKYLGWFAQKLAVERAAQLIVMGHTHTPVQGLLSDPDQGWALCSYFNCGFECPSEPDLPLKGVTFGEIDINLMQARTMRVHRSGTPSSYSYSIERDGSAADSVIYRPMMDFSTYVTIDNSHGKTDLTRTSITEAVGSFVVPPPQYIAAGTSATFWIQDDLGIRGSDGAVSYTDGSSTPLTFAFQCPSGVLPNIATASPGIKLFTRCGRDTEWRPPGQSTAYGHPFYVRFVV